MIGMMTTMTKMDSGRDCSDYKAASSSNISKSLLEGDLDLVLPGFQIHYSLIDIYCIYFSIKLYDGILYHRLDVSFLRLRPKNCKTPRFMMEKSGKSCSL